MNTLADYHISIFTYCSVVFTLFIYSMILSYFVFYIISSWNCDVTAWICSSFGVVFFRFCEFMFLRFVDYICVCCAFLLIIKFLINCLICFRFGNLFCDVLRLFVAMFCFSVYLFRSSDVFYVLLSLLILCVFVALAFLLFFILSYIVLCVGVVGWWSVGTERMSQTTLGG